MKQLSDSQKAFLNAYMKQNTGIIYASNLDAVIPTKKTTVKRVIERSLVLDQAMQIDKEITTIDPYLYKMEYSIDDSMFEQIEGIKNGFESFIMFARAYLYFAQNIEIAQQMEKQGINFFWFCLWACYWQADKNAEREINRCINGCQLFNAVRQQDSKEILHRNSNW